MCLAQEVRVDYFKIPSTCKSIFSVTYLPTAVSTSEDPYPLSWSWSACQTLSHLQVPLLYLYYFFRSLTNILTNSGIVKDCLFCLNTSFRNLRILTTPLASLLPNGFSYLENFFCYHFTVCESPEYVSQGIFCKFLSRVIWGCPISKEVWAFLFCRCKSRPQETYIQMHKAFKCLILTEILALMDKIPNGCGETTLLKNLTS